MQKITPNISPAKISPEEWKQVFQLLDTALDLSLDQRVSWLESLDATRSHLKPALRDLLARHATHETNDFLQALPQFTRVDGVLASDSVYARNVDDLIGPYRLLRELGRGGMGDVWLAARNDGRFEGQCAIKFLRGSVVHPKLVDRFRREGSLLARLTHPHIARLLDAGATDDGTPYLALEYIDGERIDRYCELKALSVEARVRLFVDVVAAVAHAHTHLIIHRDLKPSNVLVTRDGQVKLLDFGIAKLLSVESAADEAALTRIEDVALTPEYAAPEQILGELASTATDVYQLGMLLYVLLTGKHPIQQTGTRAEKLRAALDGTVPHASELADKFTGKKLQGDVDAILAMALRKVPSERHATAQALNEELVRYLNHEPVLARRGAALYRTRKFISRHRVAVGASSLAAVGLCALSLLALIQTREARVQRDQARFEASHAEASNQFMSLMLEEVGKGDHPPSMPELLDRAEQLLYKQYGDDPSFVAAMLIDLAGRYLDIGRSEKALALLEKSASVARQANDDALRARALCISAYSHLLSASRDQAEVQLTAASEALNRVRNPSVELRGECLRVQGRVAQSKGDLVAALALFETARESYERSGSTRGLHYTAVLTNIGGLYLADGRLAESYAAFKKADNAFERNGRGGTVSKLTAESNLTIPLARMGEVLTASRLMEHVMQRSIALETAQSSRLAYVVNYAHLLTRLDRADDAWNLLQESNDQLRVENSPAFVAWAKFQAGKALFWKRDFAAAESHILEAEQALQKDPIPNAYYLRAIALERSRNDLARGKIEVARQRIDALLHDLHYPQEHTGVEVRNALLAAADIYLQAARPDQANDYASAAYDISRHLARLADESADVGEAAYLLARAQQALGHTQQLRPLLTQAVKSLGNGLGATHHLTRAAADMLTRLDAA